MDSGQRPDHQKFLDECTPLRSEQGKMKDTDVVFTKESVLSALVEVNGNAADFFGSASPENFCKRPSEGWSLADNLDHLIRSVKPVARVMRLPKIALRLMFGTPKQPSRPLLEIREAYLVELSNGAQASGRFLPDQGAPSNADFAAARAKLLDKWLRTSHELLNAIGEWDDSELDQYALPHPILGSLTVREMLFFLRSITLHGMPVRKAIRPDLSFLMDNIEIAHRRLRAQHLIRPGLKKPAEVVASLAAVQAQDYRGAKWALSMRLKDGPTDDSVEQAFTAGKILRTHVLRPTWHFVTPADIRWMLELSAPRVHAASAFMYRQLELNRAIIRKSYAVLEKTLRGGRQLTRSELASAFEKAGVAAKGLRLGYFMMSAELDGIICSGARRGKQFTYALLEERVPAAKALTRDEALAELTRRYFATRGPATLHDFAWWSGLTMADARQGIEMVKPQFTTATIKGKAYWFAGSRRSTRVNPPIALLLPNYDEYFIGFKDRSAIGDAISRARVSLSASALIAHIITIDGQIVGGWKRTLKKGAVVVELTLITTLTKAEESAVTAAANKFGKFLGCSVLLTQRKAAL